LVTKLVSVLSRAAILLHRETRQPADTGDDCVRQGKQLSPFLRLRQQLQNGVLGGYRRSGQCRST
jgi:hypothetical protein